MRGIVTRVFPNGRYGFIDAEGQEYFFHANALLGTEFGSLAPSVPVLFEVDRKPEGDLPGEQPRAVNVRLAEDAPAVVDNELLPKEKTA